MQGIFWLHEKLLASEELHGSKELLKSSPLSFYHTQWKLTNIYHSPSPYVTQTPHVMTIHSHYIQNEMCLYMLVHIMKKSTGLVKQQKKRGWSQTILQDFLEF